MHCLVLLLALPTWLGIAVYPSQLAWKFRECFYSSQVSELVKQLPVPHKIV